MVRSMTCWMSSSLSNSTTARSTVEASPATRSAWSGSDSHLPSRPAISASRSLVSTTAADRKFSRTKLPRPSPSWSFLRLMIAVWGILQAQRMTEQRGDGEPVGERADHPGFGGRADISDPGGPALGLAPATDQEDHGRADQETQRHRLHPAQTPPPLGVGFRVRSGERFREGCTPADYPRRQLREAMFCYHSSIIRYVRRPVNVTLPSRYCP